MRAGRHDPASGNQAPCHPGSRQPDRGAETRPREATLPEPHPHQRDRGAVDRQIRAWASKRPFGSQEESGKERTMSERFMYVTYIRTTQEKLWDALTKPEFTRAYWIGSWQDCGWKVGSVWRLMLPDGRIGGIGEVQAIDRPRRLVLSWRNEFMPEL